MSAESLQEPLPDVVQRRAVAFASDALGSLAQADVPTALRRVRNFAPARRARLGASEIAAALERDAGFRRSVTRHVESTQGELLTALSEGGALDVYEPVEAAAVAYVARTPGWVEVVQRAGEHARAHQERSDASQREEEALRLGAALAEARDSARADRERWKGDVDRLKTDNSQLRYKLADARERAKRAEDDAESARVEAKDATTRAEASVSASEAEARRWRTRAGEVEAALERSRSSDRADRNLGSTRLRLLLDSVTDAAAGLRRELALPPVGSTDVRPGDTAGGVEPTGPVVAGTSRGVAADDPSLLEELLALPSVHVVVDGYNVTKQEWGATTLELQRSRLVSALAAIASRTGAEVTCVFDGADVGRAHVPTPRGVRVRFSEPGQTADELIRRLVAAEPQGRQVVVVSSDREVADGVRRSGVHPVPAAMLVRMLGR